MRKVLSQKKFSVNDNPNHAEPKASILTFFKTRRVAVTIGLMVGMFIAALEATAVSTAMPTVVSSLGGLSMYSWVFSAYFLTSTLTLPLWGKLSDIYGRKIFYIIGITIFMIGSVLCGQSNSMLELILFRALQGIGGGALLTLGMIIIGEIFSLKERARVQGLFGGVWGLSSIAGPLIGGFLTDHFSWRWVFYLNIPFGIIATLIIGFALREEAKEKKTSIDYKGAFLLSVLITLFLIGLTQLGKENHGIIPSIMLGSCLPLLWLLILTERKAKDPIIPLELFSNRFFKTSAITGFLIGMAMFGSISFIPLFIQAVIGTSATRAGTILSPLLLSWVTFSSISGKLMLRFGYRRLLITGSMLVSIGFVLLSRMNENTTQLGAMVNMVFLGCGMGMVFIPLLLAVQNTVPRTYLGIATSATQFFRLTGGTVGVSIMGAVMSIFMHRSLHSLSQEAQSSQGEYLKNPDMLLNPAIRDSLPVDVLASLKGVLAHSLHYVFITGLIIAILALLSAFFAPREEVKDSRDK